MTGVQTCALPISGTSSVRLTLAYRALEVPGLVAELLEAGFGGQVGHDGSFRAPAVRVASRKEECLLHVDGPAQVDSVLPADRGCPANLASGYRTRTGDARPRSAFTLTLTLTVSSPSPSPVPSSSPSLPPSPGPLVLALTPTLTRSPRPRRPRPYPGRIVDNFV